MDRPILELKKDQLDLILEITTAFALLLLIALPLLHFSDLPETIPVHFNGTGEADGYGSKNTLLVLPIIATLMCIGLFMLNRVPHIFNYPVEITEENAEKHYKNGTKLIRWLNLIIVLSFSFIEWRVIDSSTGSGATLGSYFMPVLLIVIFGTLVLYFWKSRS